MTKEIHNDTQDEIDKIMSEIESLQKELGAVDATTEALVAEGQQSEPVESSVGAEPQVEADVMQEFRPDGGAAILEETLGDLKEKEMEEDKGDTTMSVFETETAPSSEMHGIAEPDQDDGRQEEFSPVQASATPTENSESGSLSMILTGNMTLKLKYEYEGEEVSIGFSDHALMVQLSDGTEFKIPVRRRPALRRVA